MGKKILYGIEDYQRDKLAQEGKAPAWYNAAIQAAAPSRVTAKPQGGAGYGIRGGSVYIKPASEQQRKFLTGAIQAPEVETEIPSGELSSDVPMTQRELMYRDVVNSINEASKNLLNVMNRKFEYDEKSSPLYSILQKQYEREAEKAAGQAYAASVANTGGYGSSYATMAGEAARRQVMAGFDDQQIALYEAAKQEFDAERQSALDWYNTAKQLYEDADALEQSTPTTVTLSDGTKIEVDDTNVQSAYEYIAAAMQNGGSLEQVENTIREGLKNMRTADGKAYTENEINAAIDKYKGVEKAVIADTQRNTNTVFEKGLGNAKGLNADDLNALGIDATAWGEMDAGARKTILLETAGQARKDGRLSAEQYTRLLNKDVDAAINAIKTGKVEKTATEIAELAMDLEGYKDNGYLSEEEYTAIIDRMLTEIDPKKLVEEQTRSLGEKITGTDNDESGLNEIFDIAIHSGIGSVIGLGGPVFYAVLGSLASSDDFRKLTNFKKEERDMLAYLIGRKTAKEATEKGTKGIGKK